MDRVMRITGDGDCNHNRRALVHFISVWIDSAIQFRGCIISGMPEESSQSQCRVIRITRFQAHGTVALPTMARTHSKDPRQTGHRSWHTRAPAILRRCLAPHTGHTSL